MGHLLWQIDRMINNSSNPFDADLTDTRSDPQSGRSGEEAGKQAILDQVYEVALDPIRLEDLLTAWESQHSSARSDVVARSAEYGDPEIESHLARAAKVLEQFNFAAQDQSDASAMLDAGFPRSLAVLADALGRVTAFNQIARRGFGLATVGTGHSVADLGLDASDLAILRKHLRTMAKGPKTQSSVILRARNSADAPIILRLLPAPMGVAKDGTGQVLILCSELSWPPGFAAIVQEAFGLTQTEADIVESLTQGLALKEVAEVRGRSLETVKTQVRTILSKTGTHAQPELVRVVIGLMELTAGARGESTDAPMSRSLPDLPFGHLVTAEKRRLEWVEYGDPKGLAVLYCALDYMWIRWPLAAERAARAKGLRVIAPVRGGYGGSDPLPKGRDFTQGTLADHLAVLDHLGITDCLCLTIGADLRHGLALAEARPGLVRGLLATAPQLPIRDPAHLERMDKWHRFILANARYAPRVLPFLVQAGFAWARRIGRERFLREVNANSPADLATFDRPDIHEAILKGSEVALGPKISAHAAFARDVIDATRDWSGLVERARVPVLLVQGDQDPQSPMETLREQVLDYPHLKVEYLPEAGQLLFFGYWPRMLDHLVRMATLGAQKSEK